MVFTMNFPSNSRASSSGGGGGNPGANGTSPLPPRACFVCELPLACEDPQCVARGVRGGHPCHGRKAVVLHCECGVALCVPCARTRFWEDLVENRGDYHDTAVACPKCNMMPIYFTAANGDTVIDSPRVGYNVVAASLIKVDEQVKAWIDKVELTCGFLCTARGGKNRGARCYESALKHYRDRFDLLFDVPNPNAEDSPGYYRMVLARAEHFRQHKHNDDRYVSVYALPLGPLEALRFVENKVLDAYLHGRPVSNECSTCFDDIAPGSTAFSMCMCTEVRSDAD